MLTPLQFLVVGFLFSRSRSGRCLRTLLKERGFTRSAPAFYQLMTRLEQAGLVDHTVNDELIRQIAVKENIYSVTGEGRSAFERTRNFYSGAADNRAQEGELMAQGF